MNSRIRARSPQGLRKVSARSPQGSCGLSPALRKDAQGPQGLCYLSQAREENTGIFLFSLESNKRQKTLRTLRSQ
jgi:hypothetical protein